MNLAELRIAEDSAWQSWWQGILADVRAKKPPRIEPGPAYHFSHLGDVLECLDDYFVWIGHMKRIAPSWHMIFSRTGGLVLPETALMSAALRLPETLPAFGAISFPAKYDDEKTMAAKIVAFQKVKSGAFLPIGEQFYEGALFYMEKNSRQYESVAQFFVGVRGEEIVPLPIPYGFNQHIKSKRAGSFVVCHHTVGMPPAFVELARDQEKRQGIKRKPEEIITTAFSIAMGGALAADKGVSILISRGRLSGRILVSLDRCPYFFRDRGIEGDRKAKIFHYVKPHARMTARGASAVVAHYRGSRHFSWNGYEVTITVPDFHHPAISRFDGAALAPWEGNGQKVMHVDEMARIMRGLVGDAKDVRLNKRSRLVATPRRLSVPASEARGPQ